MHVVGKNAEGFESILSYDALQFLASLHRKFDVTRKQLMQARVELQQSIDAGNPIKVHFFSLKILHHIYEIFGVKCFSCLARLGTVSIECLIFRRRLDPTKIRRSSNHFSSSSN